MIFSFSDQADSLGGSFGDSSFGDGLVLVLVMVLVIKVKHT